MFTKILVPLDGSELAERALPFANTLAQQSEARLIVLRAIAADRILIPDSHMLLGHYSVAWPNQSLDLARKTAADYLAAVQAEQIAPGVNAQTSIMETEPAAAIVELARQHQVDLIVMSSHGYSGLTRWMLGSVAERVLQAAPCPVLVLRSAEPIHHGLIALDGSELAEQVLEPAWALAAGLNCKVTLARVMAEVSPEELTHLENLEHGLGQQVQGNLHEAAASYLARVAAARPTANTARFPINTVVLHGSPAQSLLDYAQLRGVDLIALSTHGRTGLQHWLYGSVTEKVLRAAAGCSMLITRPAR
jgi:nucleotide-binding universal stress UspA family protein